MLTLTENAVSKIRDLLAEENNPSLKLRTFVQGGGCSGMQYGFSLEETKNEDDFDFVYEDVTVLVDAMSMQYLQNAEIRFDDSDMGSSFVINNPPAQTTCGCGSSFSI